MRRTVTQQNMVSFDEIRVVLSGLCESNRSGILYLSTDTNEAMIIELDKGNIKNAGTKSYRGITALPFFNRIQKAKYIFKDGDIFFDKEDETLMPETADILQYLDIEPCEKEKKILIIDDSFVVRTVFLHLLNKKSCHIVLEAADGEEGLKVIESEKPDLVLLDIVLPGMSGQDVLKNIRKNDASRDIPVIILSSRTSLIEECKNDEFQANEYITKPFKPDELLEILDRYISGGI